MLLLIGELFVQILLLSHQRRALCLDLILITLLLLRGSQLSLDRERGFRARIGYFINQPRTIGISTRANF